MYAIAIMTNSYGNDEQVKLYAADQNNTGADGYDTYDTIEDAEELISEWNDDTYVLAHNEAGRPSYYIVDDNIASYIASGRNSDGSNYDWSSCSCTRNNGECCGECDECLELMVYQDRQYIIDNAIAGAR